MVFLVFLGANCNIENNGLVLDLIQITIGPADIVIELRLYALKYIVHLLTSNIAQLVTTYIVLVFK
jgi:hypothetical protein